MTILSKTFLAVAVGGIAVGCLVAFGVIASDNVGLLMAMPVGAIAFGSFLISHMLAKEIAQFDQAEAEKSQAIQRRKAKPVPAPPPGSLTLQKAIL